MAGRPDLSICIPTMDRSRFLVQSLASIASQLEGVEKGAVELCVYDSGGDDAYKVVAAFEEKTGIDTNYVRDTARIGVDRSIIKVALMGRGKFCWLLGDDDVAEPGGIAALLDAAKKYPDTALIELNKYSYSVDLKAKWPGAPPTGGGRYAKDTAFVGMDGAREFLSAFFYDLSYMSTQVVNRTDYGKALEAEKDIGEYCEDYALAYAICRMLASNPKAVFIAKPCVGNRQDNETSLSVKSEEGGGKVARMDRASGENFTKIAKVAGNLFGKKVFGEAMRGIMRHHMRAQLMTLKASSVDAGKRMLVWRRVAVLYWKIPEFWIYCTPFIALPKPAFVLLKKINRAFVKPAAALKE